MNTIPNIRAWDTGEIEPWKQSYRKPAMLKVIKLGAGMKGVICESNNIIGKGTLAEVHTHVALLNPPLMLGSGLHDKNGTEMFQDDIIEIRSLHDSSAFDGVWDNEKQKAIPQVIKFKNNPPRIIMPSDSGKHPEYWEIVGNIHQKKYRTDKITPTRS